MRLPIIYVRGFAGSTSGIDRAVDDPFYGFNEGSVHVRVGGDSIPHFYQFESPLLRLMMEQDYRLIVGLLTFSWVEFHDRPGSGGQRPPRRRLAMVISAWALR